MGKVIRTPQGGMRVDASAIAKVGILEYVQPDGTIIREYNPPDVVKAVADALRDAPVTREHPDEDVTPATFSKYARGFVSGAATFDGTYALADVVIQDAQLMSDVEKGEREEISLGYMAAVDYTPGETPDGQKYDGIRTSITPNHVAIVRLGRAGRDVGLRLDSKGDSILSDTPQPNQGTGMTPEQIAALQAEAAKDKARADAAEAGLSAAQAKLDAIAAKELADLKASAKAKFPSLAAKIDSGDRTYAQALVDAPAPVEAPKADAKEEPATTAELTVQDSAPALSARERMLRRNRGEKVV
jgi:hypothetical protein